MKRKSNKAIITLTVILTALVVALAGFVIYFSVRDNGNTTDTESSKETSVVTSESNDSLPPSEPEPFSEPEPVPEVQNFDLTSLSKNDITTTESTVTLAGSSDLSVPLLLNGEEVERLENGGFSLKKELQIGKNVFDFKYGDETYSYTVRYKYILIDSYSPKSKTSFESGSTFSVNVKARAGSTVTATFGGKTVTLKKEILSAADVNDGDFVNFIADFTLPAGSVEDKNLGKIKFVAKYKNTSETYSSGDIICKKDSKIKYIAEIVAYSAETFDGSTADDNSNPRNNYLPQGTVDYCDAGLVYYSKGTSSEKQYYKLRCGRRVYVTKEDTPNGTAQVTKRYEGTLPDHNELEVLSVSKENNHTNITLKSLYKAPFKLDLLPQQYKSEKNQNYAVTATTYEYVQINFCYATKFSGTIEFKDSDVFTHAEVTPGNNETVLKLYLKKKGAFYGWTAKYDADGNLVFSFLEPAKISATNTNEYGVDLTGVRILIDAGHGGKDSGSYGIEHTTHESKYKLNFPYEQKFNLSLAFKIKSELEKMGATVYMTRTQENQSVSADTRCKLLTELSPDYCLSVHHNGSPTSVSANGFGAYHSNVFSSTPAKLVNQRTVEAQIYNKCQDVKWHYFFLARMAACPVVLTENGFMTNADDYYNTIASEEANDKKAKAITLGIVDYFKSIQ